MTLEQKARDFSRRYPTPASHPNGGDGNWDQDCGRVMFRFGSYLGWITAPGGDISSAYRAYRGSNIEGTNPASAPIGAYHWWDIGGEANGHVAQQVDSNTLIFMGSAKVWEDLGAGIGFASVADYNAKTPAARYLGWSRDYSGGRPNLAGISGGNVTPVKNPEQIEEEELMGAKEDIMAHVTQTMEVVRREERPRLFKRQTTGELMLLKVTTGFQIGPWDPKEDAGKLESLIVNGYQLLTRQEAERVQVVDDIRWFNLLGEVQKHRRALAAAVVDELKEQGLVLKAEADV